MYCSQWQARRRHQLPHRLLHSPHKHIARCCVISRHDEAGSSTHIWTHIWENPDSGRGVIAELEDGVLPEWVKGGLPSKVNIKDHDIVMETKTASITMA